MRLEVAVVRGLTGATMRGDSCSLRLDGDGTLPRSLCADGGQLEPGGADPGGQRADHERLTGFGRVLRTLSLDELPQLWHVERGDMSLVGPRPLLVEYLLRYSPRQARRNEVLPGITGWAQVNGRNALTWEQKFEYELLSAFSG